MKIQIAFTVLGLTALTAMQAHAALTPATAAGNRSAERGCIVGAISPFATAAGLEHALRGPTHIRLTRMKVEIRDGVLYIRVRELADGNDRAVPALRRIRTNPAAKVSPRGWYSCA